MGRRVIELPEKSPYKYTGDKDNNIRAHEQCEMAEGRHTAMPATWPPKPKGRQVDEPYIECLCIHCGVNLQVQQAHATGELDGIHVILPKDKKA